MSILCCQCEQAANGLGCQNAGICGKDAKTGALQNLLLAWCRHIAGPARTMREIGNSCRIIDQFIIDALYSTLTNVNFSANEIAEKILRAYQISQILEYLSKEKNPEYQASLEKELAAQTAETTQEQIDELVEQGAAYSISARQKAYGNTVVGLQELVLCGIKGAAAYTSHLLPLADELREKLSSFILADKEILKSIKSKDRQRKLDQKEKIAQDEAELAEWISKERELLDGFIRQLAFLGEEPTDIEALYEAAMETGRLNLLAMEMLESAHIHLYGKQEPTVVRTSPVQGKCILVSGHDLRDLYALLKQTEGKGVNVYTHGEMLVAHAYPEFKKFKHLAGHYGGAWCQQQKEFDGFPGAILMTSNCIQKPAESYHDYIFTTGPVYWPGIQHIDPDSEGTKDFSPLLKAALDSPGFFRPKSNDRITIGFGADAVIGLFEQLRKAMQSKIFSRFYLIGGCDGPEKEREYFTELAKNVPADGIILTLGCGKYRFNRENFAPLPSGLPRLFDLGQCNDAQGAIRLAIKFMEEFNCRIDQLPISFYLSWFEQKAVAVLLTLLALGIKGIYIGPKAPAFITPEIMEILVARCDLKLISDNPVNDLGIA
ncbi:MAG: hydroxylamine reductase [Planctomycetia bacterium]|nr:hydroxylamine reductase [Planctomycetia bacterium]